MEIRNAKEMEDKGKTILLYGESGVGKTSGIGTLEGKTLLIDIESGSTVLRGKDIDVVSVPQNLSGLKGIFEELTLNDGCGYDNVCLDSATELQAFMLINLGSKSKDGAPTLNDYGVCTAKMRDYMRKLRDLREHGVNVVCTALEMYLEIEHNEDTVRTKAFPMMMKKLAPEVCGMFDVVGRLCVSNKADHEGERYLLLDGNDDFMAKNRYGGARFVEGCDLAAFIKACDDPPAPSRPKKAKTDMPGIDKVVKAIAGAKSLGVVTKALKAAAKYEWTDEEKTSIEAAAEECRAELKKAKE